MTYKLKIVHRQFHLFRKLIKTKIFKTLYSRKDSSSILTYAKRRELSQNRSLKEFIICCRDLFITFLNLKTSLVKILLM